MDNAQNSLPDSQMIDEARSRWQAQQEYTKTLHEWFASAPSQTDEGSTFSIKTLRMPSSFPNRCESSNKPLPSPPQNDTPTS